MASSEDMMGDQSSRTPSIQRETKDNPQDDPKDAISGHEGVFGVPSQGGQEEAGFRTQQTFSRAIEETKSRLSSLSEEHVTVVVHSFATHTFYSATHYGEQVCQLGGGVREDEGQLSEEMELTESTLAKERNKGVKLMKKLSAAELIVETQAQEAASRVLTEYQELKEYEEELSLNSMDAYRLGFYDCKKAILWVHLKIGLDGLTPESLPDESEGGKEVDAKKDRPSSS
ncbi:hypothetical protein COCNU_scaffold049646G000030 [Cocos nucifera]|nr:hypothetical protein [Cocos nucifera]